MEAHEDMIRIRFENSGRTIPQEMLDRIFEQFYRLDSSRSTQTGGSGLGLAIARQLIEAHGGTITAGSQDERIWFVISLPVRKS